MIATPENTPITGELPVALAGNLEKPWPLGTYRAEKTRNSLVGAAIVRRVHKPRPPREIDPQEVNSKPV